MSSVDKSGSPCQIPGAAEGWRDELTAKVALVSAKCKRASSNRSWGMRGISKGARGARVRDSTSLSPASPAEHLVMALRSKNFPAASLPP